MLNDNLNKFDNQFQLAIIHENKTDMTMVVIKNQEVTLAPLMTEQILLSFSFTY